MTSGKMHSHLKTSNKASENAISALQIENLLKRYNKWVDNGKPDLAAT